MTIYGVNALNCPICHKNEWENVDRYRIKAQGMNLCHGCGFVSYPEKYKDKAAVREYYRKEYRPAPNINNLYTGQRKLHYHGAFLQELISKWAGEGKTAPVITDVGAAMGMFAAWWKNGPRLPSGAPAFPDADINGVELTTSFRRVAYHEFGVKLTEDLDTTKQYDLISSYKVLEHIFDPDKELELYRNQLKPDGYLYISVPVWFEKLSNFGVGGWDIEYYYHPDHVNAWSRAHFEYILRRAGFKIIKEDHDTYDSTYLCSIGEETKPALPLPAYDMIGNHLAKIHAADEALRRKNWDLAVELWPRFPVARRARYEFSRADAHKAGGYDWIKRHHIDPWLQIDPGCIDGLTFAADVALRYDQFDDCLGYLKQCLQIHTNSESHLSMLGNVYRAMAQKAPNEEKKIELFGQALGISRAIRNNSLQSMPQAVTWAYNDASMIPIPE